MTRVTGWILPAVLAVLLAIVGIWGYNQYIENQQYGTYMDNLYQKSFFELVGYVGNIETRLSKMMVSGDQSQSMMLLSDIWRQADAAEGKLGELPISHLSLANTNKYINQLSDYCNFLMKKVANGGTLSLEEMNNLRSLHNNCVELNSDLRVLESEINKGGVKWLEVHRKGQRQMSEASGDLVTRQFDKIENTTIDYPVLIYDGPFSEAMEKKPDVHIQGATIDREEAEKIARSFVGEDRVDRVDNISSNKGDIDTWGVSLMPKDRKLGSIYVAVSKKGGKVVTMITQGGAGKADISMEEARTKAKKFLEDNGYSHMVPAYSQNYDGTAVFNFAYEEDEVIVYPDLIKVKVSLEDGGILGYEARNYLICHKERSIGDPELSLEEARKLVSPQLDIKHERLALIPTESRGERLCYEFTGDFEGDNFIVYIDANNGDEVNIFKIINTDNGTLVI